ncbi:MAG: CHC2 zinc finger domain-containing protein, partial [Spirochaetes bacterium]|nr:CHC2 zinc finger domain-containing protein [Spirochaetota bacterium]
MVKKKQLQGHILKPAGLIDQMASRVEAVKSKSSIVEVFRHYGVDLKGRSNGEYTGLCPFHDDHTPSLCVNEDKKVFNCPACGKKGNIFHLVQEKEGIDFNEALKWLERFNGAKQFFTEKKEVNDQPLKVDLPAFSLKDIVEHYQKCLNDKPLGYLKSRGFSDLQLINRFKIGFSDGSLIEKLSDSQQETLAKTGLLKKSKVDGAGHSASLHCSPMQPVYFEAFRDHIVFPIIDENGQVVELYGRSIAGKSKYPHLYQTGGHKGIFNYKATKVYDEIILTESIIDALSLIQLGLSNTTACFGTNGFTDHHLKAFKEGNVKTVIIAFDNDEA